MSPAVNLNPDPVIFGFGWRSDKAFGPAGLSDEGL